MDWDLTRQTTQIFTTIIYPLGFVIGEKGTYFADLASYQRDLFRTNNP